DHQCGTPRCPKGAQPRGQAFERQA
ncbi:MAG: hypothetical protein AVDCRST_MAG87-3606, partial [uncultured Thermomicrobiales bacterium]